MAGEIYPKFPGKGADKGWYQTDKGSRYYAGGNEFRYSDPQGRTNVGAMLGGIFSPKPLSAEKQALSDKKTAWLNSGRKGPNPYLTSSSPAVTTPSAPIAPRLNTGRGAMFMDPVGPAPEMPGSSSFMDPVAPPTSDVTKLATSPGREIVQAEKNVALVPDSTLNTGGGGGNRNNSRVIPGSGGKVQKGTDMGRSFNDLLATTNTSGYQPFSSNQLPTTEANPFEGTAPKTQTFNPAAPGITGATYDNYGAAGGVAAASSTDKSQFTPMSGKESRIEGGSERKKGGSLADALNDKAGINSYMSKFSSGDRERAANRAFLDTEKSMEALRAKEAVNGVVYAQGQHYVAGENAESPAVAITRDQARGISSGRTNAQTLLQAHIDKNKKVTDGSPATSQNPLTSAGSSVKDGFAAGAKTDFALNNDDAGNNKPAQKTIDSNFMESVDFNDPAQLAEYERRMKQLN